MSKRPKLLKVQCLKKSSKMIYFNYSVGRRKRDVDEFDSKPLVDRKIILENIEKYLPSIVSMPPGASSHDCMLRYVPPFYS